MPRVPFQVIKIFLQSVIFFANILRIASSSFQQNQTPVQQSAATPPGIRVPWGEKERLPLPPNVSLIILPSHTMKNTHQSANYQIVTATS